MEAQDIRTLSQLFVLCWVFLLSVFPNNPQIKILSFSPNLFAIFFFAFATFVWINLISTFCTVGDRLTNSQLISLLNFFHDVVRLVIIE